MLRFKDLDTKMYTVSVYEGEHVHVWFYKTLSQIKSKDIGKLSTYFRTMKGEKKPL